MYDRLIRSDRRTLALELDHLGRLTVRAPKRMSQTEIDAFLLQKQSWIEQKRNALSVRTPLHPPLSGRDGETVLYLGQPLNVTLAKVSCVAKTGGELLAPFGEETVSSIARWYTTEAARLLPSRVGTICAGMGIAPLKIRVSSARTRWGSMSSRGTLSLSRALVMCPPDVIDYVIVHELCHLRQMNHSYAFWELVGWAMPDFKQKQEWLKEHASLIRVL